MKSVTLIFPGQGSQYVGMGKNLIQFESCQNIFNEATRSLGFDVKGLCLEGPEDKLKQTEFTQPAIVTHSVALYSKLKEILDEKNISIDRVLGHSVGEYSALVAAGALEFKDAVKAVNLRGKYMQEATPEGVGAMYAIVRVPQEIVKQACDEVSSAEHQVMCANFNDPTQVVISGHAPACEKAIEWLKNNYEGKQMAIPLKVSAPFHSSLMAPATEKLKDFLDSIEFKTTTIPYIANIDSVEYPTGTDGELVKAKLIEQVCASVLWSQSLAKLNDETLFIEVGPGKVLTGLNKKINSNFKTYTLDSEESFEGLLGFLS